MKLLRYFLAIILFATTLTFDIKAQDKNDSTNSGLNYKAMSAQYQKKSRSQKKAARVLGITGVISASIGVSMAASSLSGLFDPSAPPAKNYGSTPDILMIGGAALIVTAIPISIAARKNKKLARLYMNKENVVIASGIRTRAQITSVGIKISL